MPKMKPLTFDLIEQGRFKKDVDEVLAVVQQRLIEFVDRYGVDKCKGAQGEVGIKIKYKFEGKEDNDMYSIKATLEAKSPSRPPAATVGIADREQDGIPALFVRASGSSKDHPGQELICTDEGKNVDPETGEVTN